MTNARKGTKGFVSLPLEERFWSNVDKRGPNECWNYGPASRVGKYGMVRVGDRRRRASHVAWELGYGQPFPAGKVACHSCDNPSCVNPTHIWPGTMSENALDAKDKRRLNPWNRNLTHCKYGHALTPENISCIAGKRICRACNRRRCREQRARRKARTAIAEVLRGGGA